MEECLFVVLALDYEKHALDKESTPDVCLDMHMAFV